MGHFFSRATFRFEKRKRGISFCVQYKLWTLSPAEFIAVFQQNYNSQRLVHLPFDIGKTCSPSKLSTFKIQEDTDGTGFKQFRFSVVFTVESRRSNLAQG